MEEGSTMANLWAKVEKRISKVGAVTREPGGDTGVCPTQDKKSLLLDIHKKVCMIEVCSAREPHKQAGPPTTGPLLWS